MASLPSSGRRFLAERVEELGLVLAGFFAIVVVVAGASALALLTWPSHSGTYFSWDLGEPPAAALIGGLYLASVIVFADAANRPRHETRALTVGILGLAIPTLVFTAVEHTVFDWSRPQAVAWVILFCSAPVSIALDLRTPTGHATAPQMSALAKAVLAATALASAGLAVGLWAEPSRARLADSGPIPLAGLTANYLGAWAAFIAIAATVAVLRGRTSDTRSVCVLLGSVAFGAAIAAARTSSDLQANTIEYLTGLTAMAVTALALNRSHRAGSLAPGIKGATRRPPPPRNLDPRPIEAEPGTWMHRRSAPNPRHSSAVPNSLNNLPERNTPT